MSDTQGWLTPDSAVEQGDLIDRYLISTGYVEDRKIAELLVVAVGVCLLLVVGFMLVRGRASPSLSPAELDAMQHDMLVGAGLAQP